MSWSIRLFRVKGIDIKVHLTFVLILIWAAYRWGSNTGAGLQGALFGIVATLLLFGAVTLHELSHSMQARKAGVRVQDITLLPIGGVAQMEEMPEDPKQELRIALAGPLTNLTIAGLLLGLAALLSIPGLLTLPGMIEALGQVSWTGMLAYLIAANLALGLFNLIPAFPMDGGRVLRALLALRLDHAKATRIASTVGQALSFLLGLGGILSGSFTLVFIAVFVWMGAAGEGKQSKAKSVLRDVEVRQVMTRAPQVLSTQDTLGRAVELTLSTAQADFPVVNDAEGRPVGLLTAGELLKGLQAYGMSVAVGEVMRHEFPVAAADGSLYEAHQQMSAGRLGAVPVIGQDGGLVGLLTAADVNEAYRLLSAGTEAVAVPAQVHQTVG